jgi:MFS family permease
VKFFRQQDTLSISASLWSNHAFLLLWGGRGVSLLGTAITNVVFPILIYQLTNSAFLTALLQVCISMPYVLFGLFAGAIADRVNRKFLMILSDSLNVLFLGSVPLAALLHGLWLPHLFLVVFLSETAYVLYDAASFGAVPTLVGRERLVQANSIMEATTNIVILVGPSLAGLLIASVGPALSISVDAVSYAFSACALFLIPRVLLVHHEQLSPGFHLHVLLTDIREGWLFVWKHPLVRIMTLVGIGNTFTGGAIQGLVVVYAVRALSLAPTDSLVGVLFVAGALGALFASLLLPLLVRHVPAPRITLFSLSFTALPLLGLVWTEHLVLGMIFYCLWNACYSLTIINGISLRQLVTPAHLQSRVNTTARMLQVLGLPLGAACGGLLAQITTIHMAYLTMALGVMVSAVVGWFSFLRRAAFP